jgi:filamentous hemagglutinin
VFASNCRRAIHRFDRANREIGDALFTVPLFKKTTDSEPGSFLVETDPRFTNQRTWLNSDYLLGQLSLDAAGMQQRIGDGFYEQWLIREQVSQLTGRRYLDGYADDEAQYRALMEAGVTLAQDWNLRPGVALSAEQLAQLTSDIVWLVEETVRLPDGTLITALVPKVYLVPREGALAGKPSMIWPSNDYEPVQVLAARTPAVTVEPGSGYP